MQEIEFTCLVDEDGMNDGRDWTGTLCLLGPKPPYEAIVKTYRRHFHMIYGKYRAGYYIALPDDRLSCLLDEYTEVRSNKRRLYDAGLHPMDAEIVARAIANLKKALDSLSNETISKR